MPELSPESSRKSPFRARNAVIAVVCLAALAWTARFALHLWRYEETDDAYVSGHIHQVSPQVNGQIAAVPVKENQTVRAGDLLVRLDPLEFRIGVEKAEAALARAEAEKAESESAAARADAQLLEARIRVTQAAALVKQARAQLSLSLITLNRDERMSREHAVTPAELDEARASFDTGEASVSAATANEDSLRAAISSAEDERKEAAARKNEAEAAVVLARDALRDAQRQMSYVEILSPADGRVGNKNAEVGNRVDIGQTLMAVVEPETWVEANFKETQLALMRNGQSAEVRIDAIPDHVFHARVESVAPASGAQFALLPADNATGNFTKVVQRVPVKLVFSPDDIRGYEDQIRPGLSAVVDVKVR